MGGRLAHGISLPGKCSKRKLHSWDFRYSCLSKHLAHTRLLCTPPPMPSTQVGGMAGSGPPWMLGSGTETAALGSSPSSPGGPEASPASAEPGGGLGSSGETRSGPAGSAGAEAAGGPRRTTPAHDSVGSVPKKGTSTSPSPSPPSPYFPALAPSPFDTLQTFDFPPTPSRTIICRPGVQQQYGNSQKERTGATDKSRVFFAGTPKHVQSPARGCLGGSAGAQWDWPPAEGGGCGVE